MTSLSLTKCPGQLPRAVGASSSHRVPPLLTTDEMVGRWGREGVPEIGLRNLLGKATNPHRPDRDLRPSTSTEEFGLCHARPTALSWRFSSNVTYPMSLCSLIGTDWYAGSHNSCLDFGSLLNRYC